MSNTPPSHSRVDAQARHGGAGPGAVAGLSGANAPSPRRWLVALLAVAVLLGLLATYVDLPLAIGLHKSVSADVDKLFARIGKLGDAGGTYAVVALLVYGMSLYAMRQGWREPWRGAYDRLARGGLLMVAVLAVGGIVTGVLKNVVGRARPEMYFKDGYYGLGHMFAGKHYNSFPSSHSLTAFAVALTLAVVFPRIRWLAVLVAVLVAASRLVNLDHYVSDVAGAAFIALAAVVGLAPYFLDPDRRWPTRLPWRWFKRH